MTNMTTLKNIREILFANTLDWVFCFTVLTVLVGLGVHAGLQFQQTAPVIHTLL